LTFYLKGVLDGDGYIDNYSRNPRLCLMTTSRANAQDFTEALENVGLKPHLTERDRHHTPREGIYGFKIPLHSCDTHYFIVRATCKPEFTEHLKNTIPKNSTEIKAYLKGMLDSDGSYCQYKPPYYRVAVYNSNESLLQYVKDCLSKLKIETSEIRQCGYGKVLNIYRQSEVKKIMDFWRRQDGTFK